MSRPPTTSAGTADVGWDFIRARYLERIPQPTTWPGVDDANARIRAWTLLREFDPEEAERVA